MAEKDESSVATKLGLGAVLCVVLGGLIVFLAREQTSRSASQEALGILEEVIAAGNTLTEEQVHERLNREPDVTRIPAKHRYVEEYRWSGGYETHTLYVYYTTAAAKLLTAVSLNKKMPDWEGPAVQ